VAEITPPPHISGPRELATPPLGPSQALQASVAAPSWHIALP
jgi:hypothetical protein